jgi:hypothetical membrane protein
LSENPRLVRGRIKTEDSRLLEGEDAMKPEDNATNKRNAGLLLFISGAEFLILMMVGEAVYSGYSVHTNSISDLGAVGTSSFPIYEPAVLGWGLFWLLGGYYLCKNRGKGSLTLNLLPGAGILLVAIFPENVSLIAHSLGSVIGIFAGLLVVLLSYRRVPSPLRYLFAFLSILGLVGALVEFGAYNSSFELQTLGPGGWERVIVYPLLIWEIAFGGYLLASDSKSAERSLLSTTN